ncbi:MAG: helix-turn-helix domain-containing protein, partial [Alphaproteobacteria bacterium]|nr:helix-turn-helix domain-containing protein [Alphaproteobacteria bacterium]
MAKRKNSKSVGTILREAREARKQGLSFVSDALRIREDHLAAIEEGNMERLPAPAYAAGFIRTYANYLGLDENHLIALFKEETGRGNRVMLDFPVMDDTRELPSMTLIAGLLIIVGIIYLFWVFLSDAQNTVRDRAGIDN